jgi:two-component system CheB/CheR fusion protein
MAKVSDKQYIIAIGASAGGLEAIAAFFDYTPLDAVSYILIQHLAPGFKSQMAQILAPHSKLQIVDVTDDIDIEANKIYLIPSSKFMTIEDGRLILSDKKDKQRPHMTIDHFFMSLARERGNKAIGIILSGTGNDGAKGCEAIKSAGGLVIVQDPATANFTEMPLASIATGVDIVISPEAMPQLIEDYVKDGIFDMLLDDKSENITEDKLLAILNLIKGNLPVDFTDYKRPTILRRIKRRMLQYNFSRVDKYYQFLLNNPVEIEQLAADFLIGVTSFFRDIDAYTIIQKTVIPDLVNEAKNNVLKIWVAGCATGEEAYSLAILVKEYLLKVNSTLEVKIFATDINRAALDIASKGVYSESIEKDVSDERLQNFFNREGNTYKIKHDIRKMLIFAQHDLVKNPPYCNVDLISCRNLLIYMNVFLQKKIFTMMHFGLKKGGYLFLGPSENAAILKEDFTEISNKWNILKSNKNSRGIKFDSFSSPVLEELKTTTMEVSKKSSISSSPIALTDLINIAIVEESGLSGVCTDQNLKVFQAFGDTSFYLQNKNFNFNLNELLPQNLAIAFRAAAFKALKQNEKLVLNDLLFEGKANEKSRMVDVIFKPIVKDRSEAPFLLILFMDNNSTPTARARIKETNIDQLTKDHLLDLERELAETRHKLTVAYERIESSNENMQSFNEELQSANEEMQSANEEMQSTNEELQSVNEELQTVNKEYQVTNAELTESNDDLNNYFRSNKNGQLFVDRQLLLKKYSPGTVKHVNIRESDIGRPLSNITTNIKLTTLIEDIREVIITGETITREAESSDGRVYQVMTMPYVRQNSQETDGAIVSFYDITELKQILYELDISNKRLLRINADLNNFVYSASHDLNAPIVNIEMVLDTLNTKIDMEDPDIIELSELMNSCIITFKAVIADLAKIGLMESELLEPEAPENLADIFRETTEIISERIKSTNATFIVNFEQPWIRFPKKYLRSILLNLITNAIKFHHDDRAPVITIKSRLDEKFAVLTVEDNGIGIEQGRIDFIFRMYRRINKDIEGQGIGLYLIKKIVDATGGKIEVESEPGKGSKFSIFFTV